LDGSGKHRVRNLVLLILFAPIAMLFVIGRMQFFEVPSHSMLPTLADGDRIATLRAAELRRGDIVVLWDEAKGEHIVKRITGLPGDTVNVATGALYINDAFASEPYIVEPMAYDLARPVKVSDGELFLLGDNRNASEDSHTTLETFPISNVVGVAAFRYWPLDRFGPLPRFPLANLHGD